MCVRYLGFVLLVWLPGALHAQSAAQPCHAPRLIGGYLVPEQDHYSDGTTLTYACDDGRKPAVEGWWATSTCQNGTWSHKPQCIDEKACLPPDILNAKYRASQNGWYRDGQKVRITCDNGYKPKDGQIITICTNGTWSSVLVCEKSISSCGEPPKVPHAVIIHQRYQEMYPVDTKLEYVCEDGYTLKGADTTKSIICIYGNWTDGPTCSIETRPVAGQGGSAGVGTAGGHSTSAGSGTQPEGGDSRPGAGHGGSTVGGAGRGDTTSTDSGTQPAGGGRETRPTTGHGGGTYGSGTQPAGGGSSTTSGSNGRESGPTFRPVDDCGAQPNVPNGDVIKKERLFLKYKCKDFHTLVGSDTVACYSDGSWSALPTCKETYCLLDPAQNPLPDVELSRPEYLNEGEQKHFWCIWQDYSRLVRCSNRRITFTRCCRTYQHQRGQCT